MRIAELGIQRILANEPVPMELLYRSCESLCLLHQQNHMLNMIQRNIKSQMEKLKADLQQNFAMEIGHQILLQMNSTYKMFHRQMV
jgi:lipid A disaccharide synthetase